MPDKTIIHEYDKLLALKALPERLKMIDEICETPLFTTSLGREDQVLLWNINHERLPIRIVTLQTGRLFPETLSLLTTIREQYDIAIEELVPEDDQVASYVAKFGVNGFYESLEARKTCCNIRKIQPLTKALKSADGWITGLTREQSDGRSNIPFAQWDEQHRILKFNPLADVASSEIEAAITAYDIPTNPLHDRGYPSIGCEPCTRAIKPGEHPRAGRWWWENDESQECGLHVPKTETVSLTPENKGKSKHVGC